MKGSVDDDGYRYDDDDSFDLTDSGYWKRKLRLGERKSEKDPEKLKRKEEKKIKVHYICWSIQIERTFVLEHYASHCDLPVPK